MKLSDTVVGAGFATAGALVFAATLTYPTLDDGHPGPALFPRIIATLMIVFGGLLGVRGARARDTTQRVAWGGLHRSTGFVNAVFVLVGTAGYILLVGPLGFLVAGGLLAFVLMWRLRVAPLRALLVAAGFTALVYQLFARILRVPLPPGLLWW